MVTMVCLKLSHAHGKISGEDNVWGCAECDTLKVCSSTDAPTDTAEDGPTDTPENQEDASPESKEDAPEPAAKEDTPEPVLFLLSLIHI